MPIVKPPLIAAIEVMKKPNAGDWHDANLRRSAYAQPSKRRSATDGEGVSNVVQMVRLDNTSFNRRMRGALLVDRVRHDLFLA
jgi:hypothetical protein